jgi:hypothetical protein
MFGEHNRPIGHIFRRRRGGGGGRDEETNFPILYVDLGRE